MLKPSFKFNEWIGAIGDLGTFVPIFLALVAINGLPPGRALFFAGVVYILSSLYFQLPVPVQPLKAMAAIAIAGELNVSMLYAAGLWMGIILLFLSLTGIIEKAAGIFTRPIVKGIQLGIGLMLIRMGFNLIITSSYPVHTAQNGAFGLGFSLVEFISALWILTLPQLPLTLGNAVFAVSDVANDYFGKHASRAKPRNLAISLGIANLTIGALGGLPVCHGSGGLTAHYRFGARSGGATLIIGIIFILLSLIFPMDAYKIFTVIPPWILGFMVIYVGVCHALLIKGLEPRHLFAALSIGIIGYMTGNLAYALVFGLVLENIRHKTLLRALRRLSF